MKWYLISWWSNSPEEKFVDEYDSYKEALEAHQNDPDSYPPICNPMEFLEKWYDEIQFKGEGLDYTLLSIQKKLKELEGEK